MEKFFIRIWNTIKIPLAILSLIAIYMLFDGLKEAGDFSIVSNLEYWNGMLYTLIMMLAPAIMGAIDKWLRDQGIYIEHIFNGFKLPESK